MPGPPALSGPGGRALSHKVVAVRKAVAAGAVLMAAACTAGTGNDPEIPDQKTLTRDANQAQSLLAQSSHQGYADEPVASGQDRADDKGREVSQAVKGRALFQIACSGHGQVTVTMPEQQRSTLVDCGKEATGVPFRGSLTALVVGQRDSAGAYAWRILPRQHQ
jgi:hypothetical protein